MQTETHQQNPCDLICAYVSLLQKIGVNYFVSALSITFKDKIVANSFEYYLILRIMMIIIVGRLVQFLLDSLLNFTNKFSSSIDVGLCLLNVKIVSFEC